MTKTFEMPKQLAVKYDEKRNNYHVCGGSFEFYLYLCGHDEADYLQNVGGSQGEALDVWVSIPLNGKKRLSCDVVETLVLRELHKAFA